MAAGFFYGRFPCISEVLVTVSRSHSSPYLNDMAYQCPCVSIVRGRQAMKPVQGGIASSQQTDPPSGESVNDIQLGNQSRTPRTRPPASVRAKGKVEQEADRMRGLPVPSSSAFEGSHSNPIVVERGQEIDHYPNGFDGVMIQQQLALLRSAVDDKDLDKIDKVLKVFRKTGLRFDRAPILKDGIAMLYFKEEGALEPLFMKGSPEKVTRTVIRLIKLGCDPNACDYSKNTLLMHAARLGLNELVNFLLTKCPGLDLNKLNSAGQNAAMIAHAHGKIVALNFLMNAGVTLDSPDGASDV